MLQDDRAAQYRHRAIAALEAAERTTGEAERAQLLKDAELWNRMARYEEINPPR
jgi:hypothetical protein